MCFLGQHTEESVVYSRTRSLRTTGRVYNLCHNVVGRWVPFPQIDRDSDPEKRGGDVSGDFRQGLVMIPTMMSLEVWCARDFWLREASLPREHNIYFTFFVNAV